MVEKMFYSLEEAAAKLGKTPDEVKDMASKGQLQEFRDRDKLMFKREQVDLLSGASEDDVIPLAGDSDLEPLSLSSSATGVSMDKAKEGTGISLVEAEGLDESDPSAVTRVTSTPKGLMDPGEGSKGASGSGGLLDLTKEADDTSLGAGLLEDVYGGETVTSQTAVDATAAGGGALFESPGDATSQEAAAGAALMIAEPYNGPWSGLLGGAALGVVLTAGLAVCVLVLSFASTPGGSLMSMFADNLWAFVGGAGAFTLVAAIIGWALLRKS